MIGMVVKLVLLAGWFAFLGYGIYYALAVDPEHEVIWYWLGITIFAVVMWVLGKFVWPLVHPLGSKIRKGLHNFNVRESYHLRTSPPFVILHSLHLRLALIL